MGLVPGLPSLPDNLTAWQPHRGRAKELQDAGVSLPANLPRGTPYSWALVTGCPCWPEVLWRVAAAARVVKPGSPVILAVSREHGGDRLARLPGAKLWHESKKKSKVVAWNSLDSALLDEWAAPGELHRSANTGYFTRAGLFGWDKIDPGSRLLAQHLPGRLPGRVADFGSGYGYLAQAIADKGWHELHLIEVDQRGLEAAQANLPSLDNVHLHWLDLTLEAPPGELDHVVMNPPFHRDAKQARELGLIFVERAAQALGKAGNLWMVANQALDYEKLLAHHFPTYKKLAQQDGYKVLWAQR